MTLETPPGSAQWTKLFAVAAHLVVAAAAFALIFFAKPLADDFCTASSEKDTLAYVQYMYASWSGRWLSIGIERFVLSHLDPTRRYALLVLALALVHLGSLYLLLRSVFRTKLEQRQILCYTGALFVLYWTMHPSLGQGFYWFTGAVEYQLSLSVALILMAVLVGADETPGFVRIMSACILAVLAPSLHELFAIMLCLVLVVGAAVARRVHHFNSTLWMTAAVAAIASTLFVVAAPGYSLRRLEYYPDSFDVLLTLWLTPWQMIKAGGLWVCDVKLLAATVLFLLHPSVRGMQFEWMSKALPFQRIVIGTWIALCAVGFAIPTFATGQELPERVLGGLYFVFLIGWFAAAFVVSRSTPFLSKFDAQFPHIVSAALVLLSISLVATGNARVGLHDLFHRAMPWHEALEHRYELIRTAAAEHRTEIVTPAAPPAPAVFFNGPADITPVASDWMNECAAKFFGVSSLRCETK